MLQQTNYPFSPASYALEKNSRLWGQHAPGRSSLLTSRFTIWPGNLFKTFHLLLKFLVVLFAISTFNGGKLLSLCINDSLNQKTEKKI